MGYLVDWFWTDHSLFLPKIKRNYLNKSICCKFKFFLAKAGNQILPLVPNALNTKPPEKSNIMATPGEKFVLYTFVSSQWAAVASLGLVEKEYKEDEYEAKEIDLFPAANFDPDYLKINPNGTVPSLTAPSLDKPLIESSDILKYLDNSHPNSGPKLTPDDAKTQKAAQEIIDLVHSDDVGTNLILLQARSKEEMEVKQSGMWIQFVGNRQSALEKHHSNHPDNVFYTQKIKENGALNSLYTSKVGPDHEPFFTITHEMYRKFAAGVEKLDSILVLPYAAGDEVTLADLHIAPWLAHAMWGSGTTEVEDFGPLEAVIQKTVPDFKVGPRLREWWSTFVQRESFKKVYPTLH